MGLGSSASQGGTAILQQPDSAGPRGWLSALTAKQLSVLGVGLQGTRDTKHHGWRVRGRWCISLPPGLHVNNPQMVVLAGGFGRPSDEGFVSWMHSSIKSKTPGDKWANYTYFTKEETT